MGAGKWGLAPLLLVLAGCALQSPHPEAFSFAALGDLPYNPAEEAAFDHIVDTMNGERLAFVAHVGDIKSGSSACTDALFADRKARFERSRHPFAYTPGDNEWVDCRRSGGDPLERLAALRRVFFGEPRWLGATAGPAFVAQDAYPENRRWSVRGVVFATLNVQGSNDNVGFDAANDAEAVARRGANLAWLDAAFAVRDARAVVVLFQANPFVPSRTGAYDALRARLVANAKSFARPVLVVHGETHIHRHDRPFHDADGRPVANLARVEVFGSPFIGWLRITADPNDERFFSVELRGESPTFP